MSLKYRFDGTKYEIPQSEIEIYKFLDRSTFIVGPSETGKTTMIEHILEVIKPYIASLFVVYRTKDTDPIYETKTKKPAIFTSFDEDWLAEIRKRQEVASGIQKIADDLDTLMELFNMIATPMEKNNIDNINRTYESLVDGLSGQEKDKFKFTHVSGVTRKLKNVIRKKKPVLSRMNLTSKQKTCIRYLDFKAHMCVIFDDCSAQLQPFLSNNKNELFADLFYRCRHLKLTLIFVLHSDKIIVSDYKKNAFNMIFTAKSEASAFFNRTSMFFSPQEKKQHNLALNKVFDPNDKFRHMRYSSRINPPYYWIKANPEEVTEGLIGSMFFHDLCDKLQSMRENGIVDNEYSALFQMG